MKLLGCLFLSIIFNCQCRSLRRVDLDFDKENNVTSPSVKHRLFDDEWYMCHGNPCQQWNTTKNKLSWLKEYALSAHLQSQLPSIKAPVEISGKTFFEDDTLDGCIWLTEIQIDIILDVISNGKEILFPSAHKTLKKSGVDLKVFTKRQVDRNVINQEMFGKWPLPIKYMFDGTYSINETDYIRGAIRHIESETCVAFEEMERNVNSEEYHLFVTKDLPWCMSYVGRVDLKPQPLNIGAGCIYSFGIPVHEFTHALGIWHEMQRADRDDTVNVLWENIPLDQRVHFLKLNNLLNLDTKYDVNSVMHYPGKEHAYPGKNSMETKNLLYQQNMGQRTGLSFIDAYLINKIYCSDICNTTLPTPCSKGGYQDPNSCEKCRCPPGFTGKFCEELAPSNAKCGGDIQLPCDGTEYSITSPHYTTFLYYLDREECNWRFTTQTGFNISLKFDGEFGLFCGSRKECLHWVEVQYEANTFTGPRFCCEDIPSVEIMSETNELVVLFRSNYTTDNASKRRGFNAVIKAVPNQQNQTLCIDQLRDAKSNNNGLISSSDRSSGCMRADLAIALDSSGSVTKPNWLKMLNFTSKIVEQFDISPSCSQVALLSFGTTGYIYTYLNSTTDKLNLLDGVSNMPFKDEWTNTGAALRLLREQVFTAAFGDRDHAKDIAIIVAEGPSNREQNNTGPQARLLREFGEIVTVGVGEDVDRGEMLEMTGSSSSNLYVDNFDILISQEFIGDVMNKIQELTGEVAPTEVSQGTSVVDAWNCSFEDSAGYEAWCDTEQSQDDDFDWSFRAGATPSQNTGPDSAESGQYYVYIEATDRHNGDQAMLILPSLGIKDDICFSFAYHMYGWHVDTLSVIVLQRDGGQRVIWKEKKNKGNQWLYAHITSHLMLGDLIAFVGTRGAEFSGDIGIDSIVIRRGSC